MIGAGKRRERERGVAHPVRNTLVLSDTEQRAFLERGSVHSATTSPKLELCVAALVVLQAVQEPRSVNNTKLLLHVYQLYKTD